MYSTYIYICRTPYAMMGGVEGLAWVNTKYANASDDWPDVQYHFASGSDVSDGKFHLERDSFHPNPLLFFLLQLSH